MHIGLMIYGSLESISGGYLYDRMLVDYLHSKRDQVTVFSLPWRSYPRHLLDNWDRRWVQAVIDTPLDILVQDELNHPSLFLANQKIKKAKKIPLVTIVHHLRSSEVFPTWMNQIHAWVENKYLKSIDGFIFNSKSTQESVHALGIENIHQRSLVAYPAGNRFSLKGRRIDEPHKAARTGPLRMLFVGNVIPRKGLHHLLDALVKIPGKDWTLTVIGRTDVSPRYYALIRAKMARSGLDPYVTFLGVQEDPVLAAYLRSSHVLVVPSSYEGFGIVYLEAMGFGLPVIAGNAGGARELVSDGKEGYLVEAGDVERLARVITNLIQDQALVCQMGRNALSRFQDHPTWEESMEAIREFLVRLVPLNA